MVINIVHSVSISQIALKHDIEYIHHAIKSWTKIYLLLQNNNDTFLQSKDGDLWRLLSKSIRNIPYLARYIEDSYKFKSESSMKINEEIINLLKIIILNVE